MDSLLAKAAPTAGVGTPRAGQPLVAVRLPPEDESTTIPPIVGWAFCLMLASFHFEMPQQSFGWKLPQITATLFLLTAVLKPMNCFGRAHPALLWFLVYLHVFAGSIIWHGFVSPSEVGHWFLFLLQALLVGWAGFNVWQQTDIVRRALWWFAIGALVRAVLPMLGIARTPAFGGDRISAFGQDPNTSAVMLSAGLITLLGLTQRGARSPLWLRILAWPLAALPAIAVVQSGSRGGLVALAVGLLVLALRPGGTSWSRVRNVLTAGVTVGLLATFVRSSDVMRLRLEETAEEGRMAGREELFPASWRMFLERPLGGWGPITNQYEVLPRAPHQLPKAGEIRADAHNLFLDLLTATGLMGAVPFLVGLALCVRGAWRARPGEYGILPLALLSVFLVGNLSLNQLTYKPFWVVLAFALASERLLERDRRRGATDGQPGRQVLRRALGAGRGSLRQPEPGAATCASADQNS